MKHFVSLALMGLLTAPSANLAAQPQELGTTLAEAWVEWQTQHDHPVDWGYGFALRRGDSGRFTDDVESLLERLAPIAPELPGLAAWRDELQRLASDTQARSPERLDLPHLASDLRRNPRLESLVHMGHCEVPNWVEVWSSQGVSRLTWVAGQASDGVLARLPNAQWRGVDHLFVASPIGRVTRLGIAPWNHQSMPIAPGSRLVLLDPRHLESRQQAEALQADLANFLTTRLPGEICELKRFP